MENWDILIGVLLVIVFVLLVQRTMSPFRCQEGEEEKDGNCVSNSTKDRWWAFWESPKCKRGELQSDYTCLASRIIDAMSPGAASSPQAAVAAPAAEYQDSGRVRGVNVDIYVSDFIERHFLTITDGKEYTFNTNISEQCPFQAGVTKFQISTVPKQSIDQAALLEFRDMLYNIIEGELNSSELNEAEKAARLNAARQAVQEISNAESIMGIITKTINTQTNYIIVDECRNTPLRPDHVAADAIRANIKAFLDKKMIDLMPVQASATACPTQAAVMTLGSDGKPNGVLTGPGQTITRGTTDTYVPGKVRMYGPIAIDGVGKQAGTAFATGLEKRLAKEWTSKLVIGRVSTSRPSGVGVGVKCPKVVSRRLWRRRASPEDSQPTTNRCVAREILDSIRRVHARNARRPQITASCAGDNTRGPLRV